MPANLAYKSYCTGPLGFPMPEETARQLDDILEKHSSESTLSYKHAVKENGFEHFIDKERADVSIITDDSIDKTKEVVLAKGVKFDFFQKSPIVTLGHNYKLPPIGKSLWQKQIGNGWKAKTQYAPRPETHPKEVEWIPDTIFHLVKEGLMPGKSIGFLPLKGHAPTNEEINTIFKGNRVDFVYDEIQVFEYAVCTVQCNNNALVEAVPKGFDAAMKVFFPELQLPQLETPPEPTLKAETISLKGAVTLEEYERRIQQETNEALEKRLKSLPQDIENAFARLMGHV